MKLINYGDATWLLGDEAAEMLMTYSVLMARQNKADSINVTVLDSAGAPQNLNMLIGPATMMTSQSTDSTFLEPENAGSVAEVLAKIDAIESPAPVIPTEPIDAQPGIGEYDL